MSTIVVRGDEEQNEIIRKLVTRLGGEVLEVDDELLEDTVLGQLMDRSKTSEKVSEEEIFKILEGK